MRKFITLAALSAGFLLSTQSCETQKVIINREVESTSDGKMLLGQQSADQFSKAPYSEWYAPEYSTYTVDQASVDALKKEKFNTYTITAVVGTWCEDSHREFPRLIKILETLNYPMDKMTVIAVNRKKESPSGEEGRLNIQKVPTIIISKYGKEVGRIIEFPKTGWLEKDMLEIVRTHDTSIKDLLKS